MGRKDLSKGEAVGGGGVFVFYCCERQMPKRYQGKKIENFGVFLEMGFKKKKLEILFLSLNFYEITI